MGNLLKTQRSLVQIDTVSQETEYQDINYFNSYGLYLQKYPTVETLISFIYLLIPRLFINSNSNYNHDVAKCILKYMINVINEETYLYHTQRSYNYISPYNTVKPLGLKRERAMKHEVPTAVTYMESEMYLVSLGYHYNHGTYKTKMKQYDWIFEEQFRNLNVQRYPNEIGVPIWAKKEYLSIRP
jgi:hypothetical protein